jgi:hypothetical protein
MPAELRVAAPDVGVPHEVWPYLPLWILQQMATNDAFPPSVGRRTILPVDWDGAPLPMAVERHRMRTTRRSLDRVLKDLEAKHKADCATAVVAKGSHDIDAIFVPTPDIPRQCTGAGCPLQYAKDRGAQLATDIRIWMNDPMHRGWLNDAVTIATLPLLASDIIESLGTKVVATSPSGGLLAGQELAGAEQSLKALPLLRQSTECRQAG